MKTRKTEIAFRVKNRDTRPMEKQYLAVIVVQ